MKTNVDPVNGAIGIVREILYKDESTVTDQLAAIIVGFNDYYKGPKLTNFKLNAMNQWSKD